MNRVIRTLLTASLSFVARIMRAYSARVTADGGVVEATACATSTLTSLDSKSLLQSATFVLAPSGYKSGVIYAELPSNGNGDLTFTRTSVATRVNSSGVIETVASGVPQLDYSLGGCPNFLFEPQRTNNLVNSVLSGGGSTPTNWSSLISSGTTKSSTPVSSILNNSVSAYRFITSSDGRQAWYQSISVVNGTSYCYSVYVESVTTAITVDNLFSISVATGTTTYYVDGSVISSPSSTNIVSNKRYYIIFSSTQTTSATFRLGAGVSSSSASNFILSMPQVELGVSTSAAYPTSYIPTTSAAVTRNATSFTRSNIYTNGLIGASGGTWLIELKNNKSLTRDSAARLISLNTSSSGSGTDGLWLYNSGGTSRLIIAKTVSGAQSSLYTTNSDTARIVIKWNGSTADIFENGTKVIAATAFTGTALEYLVAPFGTGISGYIAQMALWNTPLSDAQCISLSSYTTFEVAKQLLDKVIADAIADGGTYKQSNYDASIDRIVKAMEAFGTTNIASKMVAWVDPEYLPYRQSTEAGTASLSGCRKLYDLFRRADFSQTNTPSMPLLLLHSGENYWWSGGTLSNYCSTPNAAANQITGDIDIIAKISLFTKNTVYTIISKYVLTEFAYMLRTNAAGGLQLSVSLNGSTNITTQSTSSTPFGVNEIGWVRATRIASTGVVAFYTSTDGITWTQLGNTVTNTSGSIYASKSIVEVGTYNNGGTDVLNGRVFRATISNSIGGTPVVDFNPQSFNPSSSQTQWTSATGEVWTINTPLNTTSANNNYKGALVYRNMIMADGIDDAMASGNVTIGGQQVGIYSSNRMLNNVNALNTYLELSSASSTNNESFGIFNGDNNPLRRIYTRVRGTANREYTSTSDVFTSRLALHSVVIDTSLSTDISLFYNQSSIAANATGTDQSNSFTTSYPLYLFARNGNTLLSNMSLHDLMIVTDITKRSELENIIRSMSSNFAF